MIALYLSKEEKPIIKLLNSQIKFEEGNVSLTSLTTERFEEIFGEYEIFINKLGRLRDVVKETSLTAYFTKRFQEDVERLCKRYGLMMRERLLSLSTHK